MIPLEHIKVGNKIVHPNKKDVLIITRVHSGTFDTRSAIQYEYKEWDTWSGLSFNTESFTPYYEFKDYLNQIEQL